MVRLLLCLAIAGSMSLASIGCGSGSDRKAVFPVTGTVKISGGTVAGAMVTFVSKEKNLAAMGVTDADGVFHLTTYESNDGAAAGKYAVVIKKRILVDSGGGSEDEEHAADVNAATPEGGHSADPTADNPTQLLPARYGTADTTPLSAEVKSSGENKFEFSLD